MKEVHFIVKQIVTNIFFLYSRVSSPMSSNLLKCHGVFPDSLATPGTFFSLLTLSTQQAVPSDFKV